MCVLSAVCNIVQKNLPEYIKLRLPAFYGKKIDLSDVESQVKDIQASVRSHFDFIYSLSRSYTTSGYLSMQNQLTIIDQASALLTQAYVHLPLKRAMHASNPLERLRILRYAIQEEDFYFTDIEFHKELIRIFNSVGSFIRKLVQEEQNTGYYRFHWDGTTETGSTVPSGVYLVKFQFDDVQQIMRMALVK